MRKKNFVIIERDFNRATLKTANPRVVARALTEVAAANLVDRYFKNDANDEYYYTFDYREEENEKSI